MTEQMIYLDNNATTALAPECVVPVLDCLQATWGNPSSKHAFGEAAKMKLGEARASVAHLLNATPAEIVFTSSGTESNHLAILGALAASPGKSHVVASAIEHPSTLALLARLEGEGVRVTRLPVDAQGGLDLGMLDAAIGPDTALVSLMWANNETGVLFPVAEAARIAKSKGALFHTDAVQVAGKLPIDLAELPADLLSVSGHKLHAPKGVGALFVRKGLKFPAMLAGHQERNRRGGTENVPGVVGMGVAAELAMRTLAAGDSVVGALRDRLEAGLVARIPFVTVNAASSPRVANTSSVRFGELESEVILDRLDRAGIAASSGAACTAGGTAPSHVLVAMGLTEAQARATIRFSLSRYTTASDIDQTLDTLESVVRRMTAAAA